MNISQVGCELFTRQFGAELFSRIAPRISHNRRSEAYVTPESRVASQGVSQCPDPTRPDPTLNSGYDPRPINSLYTPTAIGLGT